MCKFITCPMFLIVASNYGLSVTQTLMSMWVANHGWCTLKPNVTLGEVHTIYPPPPLPPCPPNCLKLLGCLTELPSYFITREAHYIGRVAIVCPSSLICASFLPLAKHDSLTDPDRYMTPFPTFPLFTCMPFCDNIR